MKIDVKANLIFEVEANSNLKPEKRLTPTAIFCKNKIFIFGGESQSSG